MNRGYFYELMPLCEVYADPERKQLCAKYGGTMILYTSTSLYDTGISQYNPDDWEEHTFNVALAHAHQKPITISRLLSRAEDHNKQASSKGNKPGNQTSVRLINKRDKVDEVFCA